MPVTVTEYRETVAAIDAVNSRDPNRVVVGGIEEPLALVQGRSAARWVRRLAIHPSEPLLLAARAHRIGRSAVASPTSGNRQLGHGDGLADVVRPIIDEDRPLSDQELQTYKDAVGLAFLETYCTEAVVPIGDATGDALSKTLRAMTPVGIASIPEVPGVSQVLVEEALYSAGRTDLEDVLPLAWSDPVAQARNLIDLALTLSEYPTITVSGQLGGVVLLHMVRQIAPSIPVLFADTGYHFPQTLEFIDELASAWDLNLVVAAPRDSVQRHEELHGSLHETDPGACCALRKVAPTDRALAGHDTWFTALRRDQSPSRAVFQSVIGTELDGGPPIAKVSPLIAWSWEMVDRYADIHGLPRHPLYGEGYTSIGCAPCTIPTFATFDDRAGRWEGIKMECGLHIERVDPR